MKWFIIKIISIFFLGLAFLKPANNAYANAPDIYGTVVTQTYAAISGATVVWTDNRGAQRTTTTDDGGRFSFASWQNSGNGDGFGCGENPHTWRVSTLSSCSSITQSFSTTGASLEIGSIVCGPPPPPPPPTPTIYCVHDTCFRGNDVVSGPTPVSGNSPGNLGSNPRIPPSPTIVRFEILPNEYFMEIQLGNIRPTPTPR